MTNFVPGKSGTTGVCHFTRSFGSGGGGHKGKTENKRELN